MAALIVPLGKIVNTLLPLPPPVVIVAVPSQPGTQLGDVDVFIANVNKAGPLINTVDVAVVNAASVTVIVYTEPAHNPEPNPAALITGVPVPAIA